MFLYARVYIDRASTQEASADTVTTYTGLLSFQTLMK